MTSDNLVLRDAFKCAMDLGKRASDGAGLVGYGTVALLDKRGKVLDVEPFLNKITTWGDEYYARRAVAGIGTPNIAQPTLMTGMKLGTGTTAVAKSGAGAALVTYLSGSNKVFDTTHPALTDLATDTGWDAVYKTTWNAGEATNGAITEAVIVSDAGTNATSAAGVTIARIVFTAKNKTADDTLAITWAHTFNG
jgi:hypothetical protein